MKTRVKFIQFEGEIMALFPDEVADPKGNILSYMHVGQHGAASPDLMTFPSASFMQFQQLLNELIFNVGYDLEIIKE